jgi:hypothetical protein
MQIDVSHIKAADIPELEAELVQIATRRASIESAAAKIAADLAAALADQSGHEAKMASGNYDAVAAIAASAKAREAEGQAAVAANARGINDSERARTEAYLAQAQKLKAIEDHAATVEEAKRLAVKLDEAADVFNAAYDAWKAARLISANAPNLGEFFTGGGGLYAFRHGSAGVHGSLSLHAEVVADLARLNSTPPARQRVAKS